MLLRMKNRLSKWQAELEPILSQSFAQGQQVLAQMTATALDKLTETQAQLSSQSVALTSETAEVMNRLVSLEKSVQNSRSSSRKGSPVPSTALVLTTGPHFVQTGVSSIPRPSE